MAKILIIIELIILSLWSETCSKQEEIKSLQYLQEEIKNWQEFLQQEPQYQPGRLQLQQLQQALP